MGRARKAADRIRQEIPLSLVLADYGYRVEPHIDREQQFSCDLHGDGQDRKPSARLYDGQFFCFACGVSRDAISLVREKEGVDFWGAVRKLESRYGLPPLPWEAPAQQESLADQISQSFSQEEKPEDGLRRVERFISSLCQERVGSPQKCAGFWEAYDRVLVFMVGGGDPSEVLQMSHRILESCKKYSRGE